MKSCVSLGNSADSQTFLPFPLSAPSCALLFGLIVSGLPQEQNTREGLSHSLLYPQHLTTARHIVGAQ